MPSERSTPRRIPQLTDTVSFTLQLAASTEEWLDDLATKAGFEVERGVDAVNVSYMVAGNCNAIVSAAGFFAELEEVLREGNIDPMEFTLLAGAMPDPRR